MRKTYETLDNVILEAIRNGRTTFSELLGLNEVRQAEFNSGRLKDDVLNGRLQALRKREHIEFASGHWHVVVRHFVQDGAS